MKIELTEEICKEVCLKLKLDRTFKSYKKVLKKYYDENQIDKYKDFNSFVLNQSGFKIKAMF